MVLESTPIQSWAAFLGEDKEIAKEIDLTTANLSGEKAQKVIGYLKKIYSSKPGLIDKLSGLLSGMSGKFNPIFTGPKSNEHLQKSMNR
jgi:hypothetical protein